MRRLEAVDLSGYIWYWYCSDIDYKELKRYKWRLTKDGYVFRNTSIRLKGRKFPMTIRVYAHRQIMGCTRFDGLEVDHWDRNTLNNTRENLQAMSKIENLELVNKK